MAAIRALEWVEKNIYSLNYVPSHYYLENRQWEQKAFVDTGFCADGFEKYQEAAGDRDFRHTIEFVMNRFLNQFSLGNGYFGQNYVPGKGVDNRLFTRGHSWVLEGLLACMRATKKTEYQKAAEDLIDKLIAVQAEDGSFSYLLGYGEPSGRELQYSGVCKKATAILAYLFLEFDWLSTNERARRSGKAALSWCEKKYVRSSRAWIRRNSFGQSFLRNYRASLSGRGYGICKCVLYYGLVIRERRKISEKIRGQEAGRTVFKD